MHGSVTTVRNSAVGTLTPISAVWLLMLTTYYCMQVPVVLIFGGALTSVLQDEYTRNDSCILEDHEVYGH